MSELFETISGAVEQAAMSGLCIDGQLEIALQEARKRRPELDHENLLLIAQAVLRGEDPEA